MKIRPQAMPDVVSIEKIIVIEAAEDDDFSATGELEPGTFALDSLGTVWRKVETVTGLVTEFTEHDGIRRTRAKRK